MSDTTIISIPEVTVVSVATAGIQGDKGDKGDTGDTGPIGPEGPQGEKGDKGDQGDTGTGGALGNYGSFLDTGNYPLVSAGAGQVIPLGTTTESNGVTITEGNRITFAEAGTYSLTFSVQLKNTQNNVINTAIVWIKYQGEDWPESATHIEVPAFKNSIAGTTVVTVNFVATAQGGGDYVQIFWTGNSTNLSLVTYPANGIYPVAPAVIATIAQVMYTQVGPQGDPGETGAGVAIGGLTGEVLKKKSDDDYDTEWGTVDGLPSQEGNAGKFLTTDGTDPSWVTVEVDQTIAKLLLMGF